MTLFPFLAVLVCTMGVLIVLLISLVQQARANADQAKEAASAADRATQADDSLRAEYDDLQWQREILENQRKELAGNLADQRLRLSHLEEHIRRLEQQFKELQQQAAALEKVGDEQSVGAEKARAELADLKSRIEEARAKQEKIKQEVAKRPRRFAIIPYAGPNGTRRRPIYIECTERGIILQPEGIVLHASDFEGPLGPGNPLDAALRTEREYLAKSGEVERSGEPYPLLVVRPDGAVAYTVARAAMKSWDEEFGYELIEQDIQLDYPPADPNLRGQIERTIVDARQRQAALAMAMPSQFHNRAEEPGFVATPTRGGFVPTSGGGGFGSGAGGEFGTGSGFAPGGGDRGFAGGSGRSGGGRGARRTGSGGQGSGTGSADSAGGSGSVAGSGSGHGQGGPGGSAGQPLAGSVSDQARPGGGSSQGNFALAGSSGGAAGGAAGMSGGMPGAGRMRSGEEPGGSGDSNTGGSQGSSGSCSNGSSDNGSEGGRRDAKPLADKRGKNWALPKSKSQPTGITRPIYIKCLPDQLIIVPEKGDQRTPKVIAAPGPLADSADEFVSAIWKHMDQWGLAVAGGYWKPVLQVTVAHGADDRFEELRTVLQGSGIEVVRKER